MKSEFEVYMETGILGGYMPERAIGYRDEKKIKSQRLDIPTTRSTE